MQESINVKELVGNNLPKVDVKLEQNSKGVNVTIHVYEGVDQKSIHETVDKAVEGLNYGNKMIVRKTEDDE